MIPNFNLWKASKLQEVKQCDDPILPNRITFLKVRIAIVLLGFSCLANGQNLVFQTWNIASTGGVFTVNEFGCITVDKTGKVWAGSTLGGLYYYKNNAWKKSYAYGDISFVDIMPSNRFGDNSVWAASTGNLDQATTGGVYYIDPLFDFQLNDYRITRYGTGINGGLSSRLASSLAMNNGFVYVGLDRQNTTNEGGVYKMSMKNPDLPDGNSFTKVNIDIGAGISYKVLGSRGCETWFGKNNYCSGTCAAGRIFRYGNSGSFNIPALSANTTPIPFSTSPGTTNVRAIFTDPSTNFTYVGLSAGAGIAIRNANKFESGLDAPNWTMVTPANSALPLNTIVNFNAITKVGGEIWIGTNKGIFVYSGCDTLNDPQFFKMLTTANGLPSDNITDIAFDTTNSRVWITSPAGVSTCIVSNLKACEYKPFELDCKIKPELGWDYSYLPKDNPMAKPIGVAADGVARVYIKVFADANSTSNLVSARVVILDNPAKPRTMRGKVMTVLNQDNFAYSEEANYATTYLSASSDIYPDGRKEIRFWYVAPDNFCYDSSMAEAGESSRIEKVRVYSDYTNRVTDYTDIEIQIVRPPLVLVHGLASGPETWDGFKPGDTGIPFVSNQNPLFKQVNAFTMNGKGSFEENALTLLDKGSMNGLSFPIRELRKKGYASNQVDYVCHSMGALMLRTAINKYPQWYKSWLPLEASTYRKGYVHKLITINSPHNSAPVADIVTKLAPNLPWVARKALTAWYIVDPKAQIPFNFFEPKPETMFLTVFTTFMATPAVINLQERQSMGGINFTATDVRNHIITGNVGLDIDKNPQFIIELEPLVDILSFMADVARDNADTPAEKLFYTLLNMETKLVKAWKFLNYYGIKFGYPDFLKNSDLVVPLKSQLAGQDESLPHITNFPNLETFYDASHVHILKRNDVGKKVLNLLNERIESPLFSSVIPANLDPEPLSDFQLANSNIGLTQNSTPIITTTFGRNTIEIVSPTSDGPNLLADSTLNVTINLKDTAGLAYVKIYFQNNDTATISRASNQVFSFRVNPEFSEAQNIMAVAVYDKPTQIEYHVDTLVKIIQLNGVPDSFRVRVDSFLVPLGQVVYPDFEARYDGKWIRIGNNNPAIGVTFQDTAIVGISFNNGLLGKKAGWVKAYVSYLQFKDTIRFEIMPGLFSNNLNVTVASGSFKDPSIWTRGVVPSFLDSVVIETGHDIVLDSTVIIRKLLIKPGGSIKVNGSGDTLYIGFGLDAERFFGNIKIPKQNFQNVSLSIGKRHINFSLEIIKTEGIIQKKKSIMKSRNSSFYINCIGNNS